MTPEAGDEVGKQVAADVGKLAGEGDGDAGGEEAGGASPDEVLEEFALDEEPEAEVSAVEKELAETKDRMLRIAADFENYRKRARREQEEARVKGREEVLKELLPVFDNLDRAVEAAGAQTEGASASAIVEGVAMVQKQFEDGLARFGLKRFSAMGEVFDPNFHEAVAQVESPDAAPGTVVQEFQKGYMLGERLLRASMVVVAKPKAADGPGAAESVERQEAAASAASESGNEES